MRLAVEVGGCRVAGSLPAGQELSDSPTQDASWQRNDGGHSSTNGLETVPLELPSTSATSPADDSECLHAPLYLVNADSDYPHTYILCSRSSFSRLGSRDAADCHAFRESRSLLSCQGCVYIDFLMEVSVLDNCMARYSSPFLDRRAESGTAIFALFKALKTSLFSLS